MKLLSTRQWICTLLVVCSMFTSHVATSDVQAGIIPWTYNAIFGPPGSIYAVRAQRVGYGPMTYGAGYAPYSAGYAPVGGGCCGGGCSGGGCSSGCCGGSQTSYYAPASSYTPVTSYYGSIGYSPFTSFYSPMNYGYSSYSAGYLTNNVGCSNCGGCASGNCASGNCSSGNCMSGNCASGNCGSGGCSGPGCSSNVTPAGGTQVQGLKPTPLQEEPPRITPDEPKPANPNYNQPMTQPQSGTYEKPQTFSNEGFGPANSGNAPAWENPVNNQSNKVPTEPEVTKPKVGETIKQKQPAPGVTPSNPNDQTDMPLEIPNPQPVASDRNATILSHHDSVNRIQRVARFSTPTVARAESHPMPKTMNASIIAQK